MSLIEPAVVKPLPGCKGWEGGKTCSIFEFVNQNDKYYFMSIKQCISLKSDLILLNMFLYQTYILAVFTEEASKRILF